MQGSLINILARNGCYSSDNEPHVGMGATYNSYSDRHPLTVINVIKNKKLTIKKALRGLFFGLNLLIFICINSCTFV
jgi:hypothetical protein